MLYSKTFSFAATGVPEPVLTMSVPADTHGLTVVFTPGAAGTGELKITGTPTSYGTVKATIIADNGVAPAATYEWTLTVKKAGGSGSSGCNAGFGVSLLLCGAALIFAVRRKR